MTPPSATVRRRLPTPARPVMLPGWALIIAAPAFAAKMLAELAAGRPADATSAGMIAVYLVFLLAVGWPHEGPLLTELLPAPLVLLPATVAAQLYGAVIHHLWAVASGAALFDGYAVIGSTAAAVGMADSTWRGWPHRHQRGP